ncbi:hypothetical protein NDU88_003159 [Pleurodeles waltl]|uniref:Uncharacterized protein n=1 Tax=Pleurodeles waltl TaxID=8319 RepID=A0AAV7T5B6_PLEWA|nr:hypothetical protein NDU88_003159 [Pleurodeles waltl]
MQLAPAQMNRTKTAGPRLQKSPGRQLRSPHRATRQLPDALISRSASQVKPASFTGVPQISPVAGSSTQHRRGGGGEPGRHQVPEPGCSSPRHQGVPQKHTAAPARASAPRLTARINVHLILCCQGSAGPSVQYAGPQQGFAGRRPGAKPKPSQVVFPPGPRVQAPASSNLLAIPGPDKSPPQRALRTPLAGQAQHAPVGDSEIGGLERAPQSEVRRGPEGRRPQPLYTPEKGGGGPRPGAAADQASRSSPALSAPLPFGREQPQCLPSPTRTVKASARG